MKKKIVFLIFSLLFLGSSFLIFNFVLAEPDCSLSTYDEATFQYCYNKLEQLKNQYLPAQETNKKNLASLQSQLDDLNKRISVLSKQLESLASDISKREEDLAFTQKIFEQKTVDNYRFMRMYDPITPFLFSDSASDAFREISFRQRVANEDKQSIISYADQLSQLKKDKDSLEKNKVNLDAIQKDVAQKTNFLAGEVAKVDAYLAQLSAEQQNLVAAKQAALFSAAGKDFNTQTSSSACPPQAISYNPSSTTIRVNTGGGIQTMLLEDYLKGLGEMPRSWENVSNHQEAFKSQVVAARTYALFKIIRSSCRNFDVYSDTRDQAWSGNSGDGDWNSAVDATKGQFLQGNGNVIIAYYSANAGGYTLTPNQSWGGGGDYPTPVNDNGVDGKPNSDLVARCLSDSHYRWEYHYNFGRDGGIQYNDTCPGGDISNNNSPLSESEMEEIVDATIWAQRNGHVPDNSMSHDQIKSDIGGSMIGTIQSINANIVNNQYTSSVHVVGSNTTTDLDGNTFMIVFDVRSPGKYVIPYAATSAGNAKFVKYDILTSSDAHGTQGAGWYVYAYGYGHRIGLDQEGALGMASQGISYTNILSHYYQGTALTPQGFSGTIQ